MREAIDNGDYYYPRMDKWANKGKDWKKYGTDGHDLALDKIGDIPKHSWYLSFLSGEGVGDPKDETCMACCFKTSATKQKKRKEECLSKGTKIPLGASSTMQNYILAEKHQMLEKDRYARLPVKLNAIFNRDPKEVGFKLNAGSISPGFDFYLRKGVTPGNRFLNAINDILPKHNSIIDHVSTFLTEQDDGGITVFKSLKRGALYHLFLPTVDNPIDQEQLAEELNESDIPLKRFLKYIQKSKETIDEDFLWDLLSLPGVILPEGLNIVICDIQTSGKRGGTVSTGAIKCPVGFEQSTLYNLSRKTLILYKYGSAYEIICRVTANDKRNIITFKLFEEGYPLITEIVNYIKSQCHPIENIVAKQELSKHIENVSRTPDLMDHIFMSDAEPINMERAINLLHDVHNDNTIEGYMPTHQVIDAYSKVTHLIMDEADQPFDMFGTQYYRWLPVQPSGISIDN